MVDHMVLNQFNCIDHLDFSHQDGLSPFREVIGYYQYKPMSFGQGRSDWLNNIHNPTFKWPASDSSM